MVHNNKSMGKQEVLIAVSRLGYMNEIRFFFFSNKYYKNYLYIFHNFLNI